MSSWSEDVVCFPVSEEDCGFKLVNYELGAGGYLFDRVSPDDIVWSRVSPFYYLWHLRLYSHYDLLPSVIRILKRVNGFHGVSDLSFDVLGFSAID